jgi:hypothetical protein
MTDRRELAEPSKRALDHPSVSAQAGAALDTPPGNPGLDAPLPQRPAAVSEAASIEDAVKGWPSWAVAS